MFKGLIAIYFLASVVFSLSSANLLSLEFQAIKIDQIGLEESQEDIFKKVPAKEEAEKNSQIKAEQVLKIQEDNNLLDTNANVQVVVKLKESGENIDSISKSLEKKEKNSRQKNEFLEKLNLKNKAFGETEFSSFVFLEVTKEDLKKISQDESVEGIFENEIYFPTLQSSNQAMNVSSPNTGAWAQGYDGSGQTIAIIDTGIDTDHPFFSGKIVDEMCFSLGGGASTTGQSLCPNSQASQFGLGSGEDCPYDGTSTYSNANLFGCGHGTHVSGIAAGFSNDFIDNDGVAKGANLIIASAVTKFTASPPCNSSFISPCALFFTTDIISSLDRIYNYSRFQPGVNLTAVNLSLGANLFSSYCTNALFEPFFKAFLEAGVAITVASGNNSSRTQVNSPSCVASAITVGAVGNSPNQNLVYFGSNVSPVIDMMAIGQNVVSAVPGGGFASRSGTSMAAPQIAGAFAVMKEKFPNNSILDILAKLQDGATLINDTRSNGVETNLPRLDLGNALNSTASSNPGEFVVNSVGDDSDSNLGDGICQTSTAGECTLRAAIEESNFWPNDVIPDTIKFDIADNLKTSSTPHDHWTIKPNFAYTILDAVIIDGKSQNTARNLTSNLHTIEISLNNSINIDGFIINTKPLEPNNPNFKTSISGLVINELVDTGVWISDGANEIYDCLIGTTVDGSPDSTGNSVYGIYISSGGNVIGKPDQENIIHGDAISNPNSIGVLLFNDNSVINNNLVQNNFVTNYYHGIRLDNSTGALIKENTLTNNQVGVLIEGEDSVANSNNINNTISKNKIYANAYSGISLGNSNFNTINDNGDLDLGGNNLYNAPYLTQVEISGTDLIISGFAQAGDTLELFYDQAETDNWGQGAIYLATLVEGSSEDTDTTSGTYNDANVTGGLDVTSEKFSFTIAMPDLYTLGNIEDLDGFLLTDYRLTMTATNSTGSTSGFSYNYQITTADSPLNNIFINEINWAGSSVSSQDQWIELIDTSSSSQSLEYLIVAGLGPVNGSAVFLGDSCSNLNSQPYYLIAKKSSTDSQSLLNRTPDCIISEIDLNTSGEQLALISAGQIIDITPVW